jgi:putative DNA primase/helicase
MAGRGLRLMITTMNGDPKAQHSVGVGVKTEEQRFIDDVVGLTALDAATIRKALVTLAYNAEGVWRKQRQPQGEEDNLPGKPLAFDELDPWETPVDGAPLLDALQATYARFVILPSGAAAALALWTLHTYTMDAWDITPYMVLSSPQKRSGKSTTLVVASALCYKVLTTNNISPAALFRTMEHCAPTLLIDEADTFARENDELRGVLNSGHTRRTAFVIRTVGENHEPRQFCTWGAKMIAGIGALPETIRDRAIVLKMHRRTRRETVEKWRASVADTLTTLRRQCLRWAEDHLQRLRDATPDVPDALHDRAVDNWTPLCAIAAVAGGEWPQRAKQAIAALEPLDEAEEDNTAILLLADLRAIFAQDAALHMPTADILQALHAREERPWPEWGRQRKPMTAQQFAQVLAPFGVKSKTIRVADSTPKGYEKNAFDEVFSRYLPSPAATPPHMSNGADLQENSSRNNSPVLRLGKTRKPTPDNTCGGVAATTGKNSTHAKFSPNAPCPKDGCIGRLKLITGNAVMCGVCYWQPDTPAAPDDGFEDREEWTL